MIIAYFPDVDRAILRRMPATFHIGLPDERQRNSIFRRILGMETLDDDVDYSRLSKLTEGFSGSDIRETCRTASVYRMREIASIDKQEFSSNVNSSVNTDPSVKNIDEGSSGDNIAVIAKNLRPINNDDLLKAVGKLRESKFHCGFSTERFAGVGGLD